MKLRNLLLVSVAGCGDLLGIDDLHGPVDAAVHAPPIDAAPLPRTWHGALMATPTQPFGGLPYCDYTITLEQIDIELGILPNGTLTSGQVQALNVEAIVTPDPTACPAGTEIPPNIASYTLQLPTSPTVLIFTGAGTNAPLADLTVDLAATGSTLQAQLSFHRSDTVPPLDWLVTATVTLTPQ